MDNDRFRFAVGERNGDVSILRKKSKCTAANAARIDHRQPPMEQTADSRGLLSRALQAYT